MGVLKKNIRNKLALMGHSPAFSAHVRPRQAGAGWTNIGRSPSEEGVVVDFNRNAADGLKSASPSRIHCNTLGDRAAEWPLSYSLAGFFPKIDFAFLRVAINLLQFRIREVEIFHCIQRVV